MMVTRAKQRTGQSNTRRLTKAHVVVAGCPSVPRTCLPVGKAENDRVVNHQFSMFKPEEEKPRFGPLKKFISREDCIKAKAELAKGNTQFAVDVLRNLRYKLENIERSIRTSKKNLPG